MYTVKNILSKTNFLLQRNPRIEKNTNWRKYIPEPYKSIITITSDFELAWAWRYSKDNKDSLLFALEKGRKERNNIPLILKLCETYKIPITWATVGHLFLEKCSRTEGKPHSQLGRLPHFENKYWLFESEDWYEYDPCSDVNKAPEWYCPDLIKSILASKIEHEIACHTFSHIDCSDSICPGEIFNDEIAECKKLAGLSGLELRSFVHPGHTTGNLDNLVKAGFNSFQTDPGNILGYPVRHKNGLWELKRSYELVYRNDWSIDYHIYRYSEIINRAIKNNAVCNFWFHPSFENIFLADILPSVFQQIDKERNDIWVTRVGDYVKWLNKSE